MKINMSICFESHFTLRKNILPICHAVQCPPGSEEIEAAEDPDEDFTQEWEFRHAVENVYKYKMSVKGVNTEKGCNAYVSTKTQKACLLVSVSRMNSRDLKNFNAECQPVGASESCSL
jgi:hypothetical protein